MVANDYGQWQGFANQQDQIAASNYFASIQAAQRARQIAADEQARQYNAWVQSQQYAQQQAAQQAQEAERQREWTAEFGLRKNTGEQNLDLTRKYYDWQMTKPDERVAALKDHATSVALSMVQQGFPPDVAAKATGLGEDSYEKTVPVFNFVAEQSQKEASAAEELAKRLNDAQKEIQSAAAAKIGTPEFLTAQTKAKSAQNFINRFGNKFDWVAKDDNTGTYYSIKKPIEKFKWKAGDEQGATTEPDSAATPAPYEPETTPADMGISQALMPQIRRPVFLGPYVPAAMVRSNDAMAAQYANQLLAQYPGMTRDQAKVEARKLYP